MTKHLILLLIIGLAWGRDFKVELLHERNYPWEIKEDGTYAVKVGKAQTILKMKATTNSPPTERITWKTKNKFYWGDGMRTDTYPAVNPASYTKDGLVYSMVGLMPEMKDGLLTKALGSVMKDRLKKVGAIMQEDSPRLKKTCKTGR